MADSVTTTPNSDTESPDPADDPFERAETSGPLGLFQDWLAEATAAEPADPEALTLATSTPEGAPSARMVLLKGVDTRGFVFYTNLESRKAGELAANPQAALLFYWKSLGRQVRVEGAVERVADDEADAYFRTRPRGSQIGAWASRQSRPLTGRRELEDRVAEITERFAEGDIPRPPYWSGFRLVPRRLEFWRHGRFRLHDRLVFTRTGEGWRTERLYP